ncbi:C40 family peptidase [Lactobacillus helveticus]|uniref:C40 family peptidase n=1 Tax=Lactobacillus helveticus TaxID=1587 RepID=UPI000CD9BDCE|nr:C40 family peptidase [Lactobacillus helveticus]MBO1882780.1 C40 family peptidase [Lactobacillus helveticus]POO17618.1 Protein P54 [Lactobacillus helveticus]QYH34139.1 C40 family peptidase [Lactobacillus helveticus]GFP07857.1 hydrolase [Lactobacillus helveticus]GFP16455.1 hydrolase [Lactobacillus helveticus]
MNIKSNFVKVTAAAALTLTGVATVSAVKPDSTTANVQAATTKVKINYVPGYGINIWDNYNHGHFTGQHAPHGTTWNVINQATDKKGRTWYQVGEGQWIMAKYTVPANSKKVVKTTKKSVQATGDASAVITLASAQLGKAYVWGGNGGNGFDCSGLITYVYSKAAGVNLGRTTYDQVKQGSTVSMDNLQPGDLLFWGSASAPYHVGIYVGNNQYIHAATPGQGVIKQTLSSYFYPSVAKRVL